MIGVLANTIAVIIGSAIGLIFKKGIPEKLAGPIMTGIGMCTIYIGVSGALKGENTLILIVSVVLGAVIGTLLDINGLFESAGDRLQKRFSSGENGKIAEGFVTACCLFCIGSMTIVGSINAGLGDNEMLFTKSLLDFISAIMLSVSLGIGVLFSAGFVLVFQGAIALAASFLAPVLTTAAINELVCCGSVLIIGLGLNLIGITKIKVADYMPAIIIAPILALIFG